MPVSQAFSPAAAPAGALPDAPVARKPGAVRHGPGPALLVGALGVVYGDIGTSPLYAFKEAVKAATAGGAPAPEAATGAVSLILWSLILIVSLKYAVLILRADNRGEGGIVAMLALLGRGRRGRAAGRRCCWWSGWSGRLCCMATARSRRPSRCCRRSRA